MNETEERTLDDLGLKYREILEQRAEVLAQGGQSDSGQERHLADLADEIVGRMRKQARPVLAVLNRGLEKHRVALEELQEALPKMLARLLCWIELLEGEGPVNKVGAPSVGGSPHYKLKLDTRTCLDPAGQEIFWGELNKSERLKSGQVGLRQLVPCEERAIKRLEAILGDPPEKVLQRLLDSLELEAVAVAASPPTWLRCCAGNSGLRR